MKVVFWWNIPCEGMIGVFRSYYLDIDKNSILITGTLSRSRKAMGWEEGLKINPNHHVIEDDEWQTRAISLLYQYKDYLHIFNGIVYPTRIVNIIKLAINNNIAFCNMSESFTNMETGFKSIIKFIYLYLYLPLIVKKVANHSLGVICLSGSSHSHIKQFMRLGFSREDIFPFGYYTDEKEVVFQSLGDGKIHILCPGLHEYYKGVDILINALNKVIEDGNDNFICHITGKGSQTPYLKKIVYKLNLQNFIIFEGVLENKSYKALLSHIDILVAPGRIEPWGIRINEAIQRGNVVIVSDRIGASELIRRSGGGDIFTSQKINELAEKIKCYLNNHVELEATKQKNVSFKDLISCRNQAKVLHTHLDKMWSRISSGF